MSKLHLGRCHDVRAVAFGATRLRTAMTCSGLPGLSRESTMNFSCLPSSKLLFYPLLKRYTAFTAQGTDMAHKKGQGSTRNGRDSNSQRLGIKKFGGEAVIAGNIIVRQCGTKWRPGRNVGLGSDYTIFALVAGKVFFDQEGRRVNVAPEVA